MKKLQSPQTTVAAVLILIGAVLKFALIPIFDADPNTVLNFEGLSAAAVIFYGFWKSRDQKQHDKDVGAA